MREVPHLLAVLPSESLAALLAVSTTHRRQVHDHVQSIKIYRRDGGDVFTMICGSWPRLSSWQLLLTPDEECSTLHCKLPIPSNAAMGNMVKYHRDLTSLQLMHGETGAAAMRQICQADWPHLRSFCLYRVKLSAAAIQAIPPGSCSELRSLKFYYTQLNEAALAHLAAMLWPKLRKICLVNVGMNVATCMPLCSGMSRRLRELHLEEGNISVSMLHHLGQASWPSLIRLTLRSNTAEWGAAAGLHIAQADWASRLEEVDLSSISLRAPFMRQLVRSQWPQLRQLHLHSVSTDAITIAHLAKAEWPLLEEFQMTQGVIDLFGLHSLLTGNWQRLQRMYISADLRDAAMFDLLTSGSSAYQIGDWRHKIVVGFSLCVTLSSDSDAEHEVFCHGCLPTGLTVHLPSLTRIGIFHNQSQYLMSCWSQ